MAKKMKKPTAPRKNPTVTAIMDRKILEADLRSAQTWNRTKKEECEKLKKENDDLSKELWQWREAHNSLKMQLAGSEKEKTDLAKIILELTKKIEEYEEDIRAQCTILDKLRHDLKICADDSLQKIKKLEQENKGLKENVFRITAARDALKDVLMSLYENLT
jgi:chromosome segregation ATPase